MQKIIKNSLLVLIAINFLYCLSGAVHYPLTSVDAVSIWMMKAKLFYYHGVFPLNQLNSFHYGHPQYPILLPLFFSLIYKITGGVNEMYVIMLYPFTYLTILYLCFKTLRLIGIRYNIALLFTYIYSMLSPLLAMGGRMHGGEADIFIVLGVWLVLLFTFKYSKDKKDKWLYLMVFVIVLMSNIKMEGVFITTIFLFIKHKKKYFLLLLSIALLAVWMLLSRRFVTSDLGYQFYELSELVRRTINTLFYMVKEMLNFRNWYIFWLLSSMVLLVGPIKNRPFKMYILPTLFMISILFVGNYVFSVLAVSGYVSSSMDRVLIQLSPFYFPIFAYKTSSLIDKIA